MLHSFSEVIGIIADICILVITAFTMYLTVLSRKISLVSMGTSYGTFYGDSIHFLLKNSSLHSIPVVKVFVLKKIKGKFYQIMLEEYGDDPLVIDSWHIKRIDTEPFTTILDWPSEDKRNWSELHKNAVLGVNVGDGIIWVKPYKNTPLKDAKKAYKDFSFLPLSVVRNSSEAYKIPAKSIDVERFSGNIR